MKSAPERSSTEQQVSAKRIRHAISTGLSFIETSVRNLSGKKPDLPKALKLYGVGTDKLHAALAELDGEHDSAASAESLGYNGIREAVFTAENPAVVQWTTYFEKRTAQAQLFAQFEATNSEPSRERAVAVAALWQRFSAFMPWFLCQAAAMVSTNEKRHYVIQTAFEELGMRDAREIHPDMFWDAAKAVGIAEEERAAIHREPAPAAVLASLRAMLLSYKTDEEVLGILLGLEIPARENIETVFSSLAHSRDARATLDAHKFFVLHRQIEIEHVRLTVSNFLRFCTEDAQKERFIRGFDDGLAFWRSFWGSASDEVSRLKGAAVNA